MKRAETNWIPWLWCGNGAGRFANDFLLLRLGFFHIPVYQDGTEGSRWGFGANILKQFVAGCGLEAVRDDEIA